jgi:hypothetical protein
MNATRPRSVTAAVVLTLLSLVASAPCAVGDELLVLADGSAIAVDEMVVRGGRVEVRLPGTDQAIAYALSDVDLGASGLAPAASPSAFSSRATLVRGGFDAAIAPAADDSASLTITDRDVGHVRPGARKGEEDAAAEGAAPARTTSLLVSNLAREVSPGGVLTVSGTVTNSGDVAVSAIAVTADAQDGQGASLGRGTTGISSTLGPGEAAEFSIAIPVEGRVANLKVSAVAALSEFEFEPIAAPSGSDEGAEETAGEELQE